MNSHVNQEFFFSKVKVNFLISSKFWLPRAKTCEKKLKWIQTNNRDKFVSAALKNFCKEGSIIISYVIPYRHKKNGIAK